MYVEVHMYLYTYRYECLYRLYIKLKRKRRAYPTPPIHDPKWSSCGNPPDLSLLIAFAEYFPCEKGCFRKDCILFC